MELNHLSHIHSSPSLVFPLSKRPPSSRLKSIGVLAVPLSYGYGKLKAPHPSSFLINAVLPDPPAGAAPEQQNLEKKITSEGATNVAVNYGSGSPLKTRSVVVSTTKRQDDLGLIDTPLESTWVHRVWVTAGCAAMGVVVMKAMQAVDSGEVAMGAIMAALIAYVLADLSTGVYHWAVDNYGDASTPVFGPQIDSFQGHHKRPWTITKRQFANNMHGLACPATFASVPFLLAPNNAYVHSFIGVFTACVVFSQQFHAWAHTKKTDLPAIVIKLQDMGVLVSRKTHGAHHRCPYNADYCIVSGLWNRLLDNANFFASLERFILATWGVRPRSWSETSIEEGSYYGSDLVDNTRTR